jgi:hypothetical protein
MAMFYAEPGSNATRLSLTLGTLSDSAHCPPVQVSETVQCPFCGQGFELVIDTSVASQHFTTDCEVCCRPFEVFAACEPGEILNLDVAGN